MGKWWNGLSSENQFKFAILFFVVGWLIWIALRGGVKGFANALGAGSELAALNVTGVKPTYTDASYKIAADKLYVAMKGMGTDEASIFEVFSKMKNDADMIKLELAFGVRDNYDLTAWLKGDLSAADIATLNQLLINKGITKTY